MKLLALFVFIIFCLPVFSQNVDQNFKPVIKGVADVTALYVYPNGDAIIGGNIFSVGTKPSSSVIKLNNDGTVDTKFKTTIYTVTPGRIKAITEDNQDKILVGAEQLKIDGINYIVRLNADGSADESFSNDGKLDNIMRIEALSDGKYLVSSNTSVASIGLDRLNNDGSIDETFNAYEEPYGRYSGAFKALEDGKYLCAIHYTSITYGTTVAKLIRLNSDGSLDETFTIGECSEESDDESFIHDIELQSDGKIIIAGNFNDYNGQEVSSVIRLNSDGTIDPAFLSPNPIGSIINQGKNIDIEILDNGKIIIAGGPSDYSLAYKVACLNNDGSIDDSYNIASFNVYEFDWHPIIGQDTSGVTYVAGNHIKYEDIMCNGIAALDTTGVIITDYLPKLGGKPIVNSVYQQADGKIIIGGQFSQIDTFYVNNLARFNKDGAIDTTFLRNIGTGPDLPVNSIACQSDKSIIIGGDFLNVNGVNTGLLARLDSVGKVDHDFKAYVNQKYMYNGINKILVDDNDKIIIGGVFDKVNLQTRIGLAFLNHDGSLDTFDADSMSFNVDTMLTNKEYWIYDMDFQSDKKLIVGGWIINEIGENGFLYRIDQKGVVDDTFVNSVSDINVSTITVLDNDSIIVGNELVGYQDTYIKQLDVNGNIVDNSSILIFQDENIGSIVSDIQYPGDDQLIIGGRFTSINGIEKPALAKVSLKGDVDEYFKYDVDGYIKQFFQEDSTHLFVVGDFNRIGNDYDLFCIARIDINFPDNPTDLVEDSTTTKSSAFSGINISWNDHSYNETGFSIERSLDNISFNSIATVNSNICNYNDQEIDDDKTYYYRVKAYNVNGGSSYSNVAKLGYSEGEINLINNTINNLLSVLVLPNPGNGKFLVRIDDENLVDYTVEVYSISGKCVYRNNFTGSNKIPIDISKESAGLYVVKVSSENNSKSIKYLKE